MLGDCAQDEPRPVEDPALHLDEHQEYVQSVQETGAAGEGRADGGAAGGCSEDCKYCSQSSSYKTPTKASRLVDIEPVLQAARDAKANGSTRFCMGAAWRDLAGRKSGFEKILTMVKEVRGMGMEGECPSAGNALWACSPVLRACPSFY